MRKFLLSLFIPLLLTRCADNAIHDSPAAKDPETAALDSLQQLQMQAQEGDLVVRLNDDFVSEQLRWFNEKEKLYSHAGIVVNNGGVKKVVSVLPAPPGTSPLVYIPIDSFLMPGTTTLAALYRYDLQPAEKDSFLRYIRGLQDKTLYFDSTIHIATDDSLYCSEMIYKGLKGATANRIDFRLAPIPEKMQKTVYLFYRGRFPIEQIASRRIIYIDNLYSVPQCRKIMAFRMKHFPQPGG